MSDSEDLPSDIEEAATSAVSTLLPSKSKDKYKKIYNRFTSWCEKKNLKNHLQEKVLLAYFSELSKSYSSSSLWAFYSMIRAVASMKNNIDISKYAQLQAFLKRKSEGYKPKKSRTFTKEEIARFLKEADDKKFLLTKVGLVIGIAGACRKQELTNLLNEKVKDKGSVFHIEITTTKTKISREFFITSGGFEGINMVEIVRRYKSLRPSNTGHDRFFVGFRQGVCIRQPVGINTFGNMPKNIASFLNLPYLEQYTGHCFRRSSTSILADSGADLLTIKRHGGWKSNTVAEGYIDTSKGNKKKIAAKILGEETPSASNSGDSSFNIEKHTESVISGTGINFTFNIYNK
ncbi:hypothetical protein NQ315_013460 [Exocentrus adspersus]|uniref:Tyr recombinase domain-containing protein n=1 Tax=Exocentrus adspersus TaxID=1586481 RepID=A0AAV8VE54_9CUCU|nr:hypothetical protein NQ315_013460 [Exocentrus adspersus]